MHMAWLVSLQITWKLIVGMVIKNYNDVKMNIETFWSEYSDCWLSHFQAGDIDESSEMQRFILNIQKNARKEEGES